MGTLENEPTIKVDIGNLKGKIRKYIPGQSSVPEGKKEEKKS